MRRNFERTIQSVLLVSLLMPAGMLLATETHQPPAVTSSTANWVDAEQASNLLSQMQIRAIKVRKEVARLQVQGNELRWQVDAARLSRARTDTDAIGSDLEQLDQMKSKLEPWQQSLVRKITPEIHEIAYQMDAAIKILNAHQSHTYLSLSEYPQNIDQIYNNANNMVNDIQTVTQYAHAEQKMAELNKGSRTTAHS